MDEKINKVTEAIIGAAFEVQNSLGSGFLEVVYQRAMAVELKLRGLRVEREVSFAVTYKGSSVGTYVADLIVEGNVLVELKCVDRLANEHAAQCINYLAASRKALCLLINFQRATLEWKRIAGIPLTAMAFRLEPCVSVLHPSPSQRSGA